MRPLFLFRALIELFHATVNSILYAALGSMCFFRIKSDLYCLCHLQTSQGNGTLRRCLTVLKWGPVFYVGMRFIRLQPYMYINPGTTTSWVCEALKPWLKSYWDNLGHILKLLAKVSSHPELNQSLLSWSAYSWRLLNNLIHLISFC